MMQEPQTSIPAGRLDHDIGEQCAGCGADALAAPEEGGANCARCGQWQALCDECMPNVSEYARDAVWCCPECQEKPLDS